MNKKRIISGLLCVIYLVATLGPVWSSLSCRCARIHGHRHPFGTLCAKACAEGCATACTTHAHDRLTFEFPASAEVEAPCCAHHHSTENPLYTLPDSERAVRTLAPTLLSLPDALLPVQTLAASSDRRAEVFCAGRITAGAPTAVGLRAPPVA